MKFLSGLIAGLVIISYYASLTAVASDTSAVSGVSSGECVKYQKGRSGHLLFRGTAGKGVEIMWALDSGAGAHLIPSEVHKKLTDATDLGKKVPVAGAVGRSYHPLIQLGEVSVNAVQATLQQFAVVQDLPLGDGPVGVLGQPFFKDHIIQVDSVKKEVCFFAKKESLDLKDVRQSVPLNVVRGGFPVIDVEVNGAKAKAILDLGAGKSILVNPELISLAGLKESGATRHYMGATAAIIKGREFELGTITVGGYDIDVGLAVESEMEPFKILIGKDQPAVNLSATKLTDKKFVLDYKNKALHLW